MAFWERLSLLSPHIISMNLCYFNFNLFLLFYLTLFFHRFNGRINSVEGVAKIKDPSQPAILAVSFFKGIYSIYVLYIGIK